MDTTNLLSIDFDSIARQFRLQESQVRATVELLDEGNTVPFITRYRKDRTGGLDEEKIRLVEEAVVRRRQLNERKDRVLRSIKAQNQLTPELEQRILAASSLKVLEDLYLPYRPKKQTLATVARQRGLEPLAMEIVESLLNADHTSSSDTDGHDQATPDAAAEAASPSLSETTAPAAVESSSESGPELDAGQPEAAAIDVPPSREPEAGVPADDAPADVPAAVAGLSEAELQARCEALIDPEKELRTVADVLTGVRHILAEVLSERADVRALVRRQMWSGQLVSKRVERSEADDLDDDDDGSDELSGGDDEHSESNYFDEPDESSWDEPSTDATQAEQDHASGDRADVAPPMTVASETPSNAAEPSVAEPAAEPDAGSGEESPRVDSSDAPDESGAEATAAGGSSGETASETAGSVAPASENESSQSTDSDPAATDTAAMETAAMDTAPTDPAATENAVGEGAGGDAEQSASPPARSDGVEAKRQQAQAVLAARRAAAEERRKQRREARHRKRQKLEQSFKDYFNYGESLKKIPHYRVLAVNRGERCKVLRVKIQFDQGVLRDEAEKLVIPTGHAQSELLRDALHDSLARLVIASIDREIRRELTERAETHAVKVFAHNLRKLLLQAPLCGRRVLAIDPGFRSGCKLVAMDEFGNVLGHTLIHVIGAAERVQQSRARLVEQIRQFHIGVVAIGNGTACRETEQLVAGVLANELADEDVHYLIVNEAGASVYSTSQIGREELPRFDATVRGAVSIGRRVLDPLSELVKIDPASIGVGLYQHDVKAKHLRTSLDAVVESCVNFVGVDVNSASPALLGYVSGLNQLTARRLYEYRQAHGPFTNREQFRQVPGIGEATFVQAAGFLRIVDSENPLDATWIHPESYETARRVLEEIGADVAGLSQWVQSRRQATLVGKASQDSASAAETHAEQASTEEPGAPAVAVSSEVLEGPESVTPPNVPTEDAVAGESGEVVDAESSQPESVSTAEPTNEAAPEEAAPDEAASNETAVAAEALSAGNGKALLEKLKQANVSELAEKLAVGELLLQDILASLARPGRDPREDLSPPAFRREILKLEDLKAGMELSGTVLNVVDFGAFVDIGLSDSGLIHVSRLADRFVSDPHEVVSVGDILNVWVVEVDEKRRRVSLTAIRPGTESERPRAAPEGDRRGGGGGGAKRRKPRRDKQQADAPAAAASRSGGRGRKPAAGAWKPKPKPKPKPVVPITDAMVDGKEPMRTFSDLQQFFKRKLDEDRDSKNKKRS